LSGTDALAMRASKKLRSDELYLTSFLSTRLKMELDRVPLWRGDHVEVRQLVEDFARYLYLPRLKDPGVLLHAIGDGVNLLIWMQDIEVEATIPAGASDYVVRTVTENCRTLKFTSQGFEKE
jgi:hypothetical protein